MAESQTKKKMSLRSVVTLGLKMIFLSTYVVSFHKEKDVDGSKDEESHTGNVAFSIWLGILIDGIPESMLIGFMQSEGENR